MDMDQAILTSVLLNIVVDCEADLRHLSPPLQHYVEELLEEYHEGEGEEEDALREKLYNFAYEQLITPEMKRKYN